MTAKEFSLMQISRDELLLTLILDRVGVMRPYDNEDKSYAAGFNDAVDELYEVIKTYIEGEHAGHYLRFGK
jgi:hypothetical protein